MQRERIKNVPSAAVDDGKEGGYVLSEEKSGEGSCLYLDEVLHQQGQQESLFTD